MAAAGRKRSPSRTPDFLTRKGGCLLGAAALLVCGAATPLPELPGVGRFDPRVEADPALPPWSAIALLLIPRVSRCTAVAVAPHWIATAAHCVYNRALDRVAPAPSIHLLLHYRSGDYSQLLSPDALRFPSGADPGLHALRGSDFVLLHVPATLTDILPPVAAPPGTAMQLGGFGQDRAERLVIDPDCTVSGTVPGTDGQDLLRHDCSGTRGTSGGALVVRTGPNQWGLAGVQVAAELGRSAGFAVSGARIAAILDTVR